jgi:hypothetical protein
MGMTAEEILLAFFIINWLLVIVDASLGYFLMPMVIPRNSPDVVTGSDEGHSAAVVGMRRLLTIMVVLYMTVNCYAYYQKHATLLYVITGIVLVDIIAQLALRRHRTRRG